MSTQHPPDAKTYAFLPRLRATTTTVHSHYIIAEDRQRSQRIDTNGLRSHSNIKKIQDAFSQHVNVAQTLGGNFLFCFVHVLSSILCVLECSYCVVLMCIVIVVFPVGKIFQSHVFILGIHECVGVFILFSMFKQMQAFLCELILYFFLPVYFVCACCSIKACVCPTCTEKLSCGEA